MKTDTPCAKCGSTMVIPRARVIDRGDYQSESELRVGVKAKPANLVFVGEAKSEISARVCGDCGFIELYAKDAGMLRRAHLTALENKK